jgi:hypothetical protein
MRSDVVGPPTHPNHSMSAEGLMRHAQANEGIGGEALLGRRRIPVISSIGDVLTSTKVTLSRLPPTPVPAS